MAVEFVAEVSSNHHRDLSRCLTFIDKASEIGCWAVKFQLFRIDKLFAPEILARSNEHRKRQMWELPAGFLPELAQRCKSLGLKFGCTPFYLEAVEDLFPYVDYYKVASYELLWTDLLRECALTGKPVVLSTGMATLEEIRNAVEIIRSAGSNGFDEIKLLHCVSGYPALPEECNLSAIETLRRQFGLLTGWSDHTVNPGVIYRAVHRWDASMIEFHLDLEGEGVEYRSGHCWLPGQIGPVIKTVLAGFSADGSGKKVPAPGELPEREWRADPVDGLRPMRAVRQRWCS